MNSRTASYCDRADTAMVVSGGGADSEWTRQVTSPGTPSGSRVVASTFTAGCRAKSAAVSAAQGSKRCSQLSRTSSVRSSASAAITCSTGCSPGGVVDSHRGQHRRSDLGWVGHARELHEPDPARELLEKLGRHRQRETCLAHAA